MPNLRGLVAGSLHLAGLPATLLHHRAFCCARGAGRHGWRVQPGHQFVLGFFAVPDGHDHYQLPLPVHDLSLLILPILLLAELLVAGQIVGPARRILIASLVVLFLTPLYAVLQFWFREMNLMVIAVAMFAAGTAIALTVKRDQPSVNRAAHKARCRLYP